MHEIISIDAMRIDLWQVTKIDDGLKKIKIRFAHFLFYISWIVGFGFRAALEKTFLYFATFFVCLIIVNSIQTYLEHSRTNLGRINFIYF